jgi:hypothetical protein
MLVQDPERSRTIARFPDAVAFPLESPAGQQPLARLIVHDQDARLLRRTRNTT